MTTTLTAGATAVTPHLVIGYQAAAAVNTKVHKILGRRDNDVTLRAADLRSGPLELFFLDLPAAQAAYDLHTRAAVITLADTTYPTLGMRYVVAAGSVDIRLDDQGNKRWLVAFNFQEIL